MGYPNKIADPSPEHVADLALISEALWKASAVQGWCTEFEGYIDKFNRNLRVDMPMPKPTLAVNWYLNFQFIHDLPEGASKDEIAKAKADLTEELKAAQATGDYSVIMGKLATYEVEDVKSYDLSVKTCGVRRDTGIW